MVGGRKSAELAAPADAVIASQGTADYFWYAEALATLEVGDRKDVTAVMVTVTDLSLLTFTFTRRADQDGARAYNFTDVGATFTGTILVDPDRLPRRVEMKFAAGRVVDAAGALRVRPPTPVVISSRV
jgi:hypothetical protein